MKKMGALLLFLAVMVVPTAAHAGGSDSPTPYTVDTAGVTLPSGKVFEANGHVNIKYLNDGKVKSAGVHFDPNNNQPGGKWIGRNFIPWSAFASDIQCVTWVQVAGYNEHFGEGGQKPLCLTKPPTAPPTDSEERKVTTKINCEERIIEWRKERHTAVFDYDWNKAKWVQTGWNEWKTIETGFDNKKDVSCEDLPTVGTSINAPLIGAGVLLVLGGAGLMLYRRRTAE